MRVLVTGSRGYIGSVVVPHLLALGYDAVGLDTGLFADCVLGPVLEDPPYLDLDLRDITPGHLYGFDAVIHLAALPYAPSIHPDTRTPAEINRLVTTRLALCSAQAGVRRFLWPASHEPHAPTDSLDIGDGILALADSAFTPTALQHGVVFGFSPRMRTDTTVNHLVGSALLTGELSIAGDGTAREQPIDIHDIAAAYACALTAPEDPIRAKVFDLNAGWDDPTVSKIAETVTDLVPGTALTFLDEPSPQPRQSTHRTDSYSTRTPLPGFAPTRSLSAGIRELYRRFLVYGLTHHDFSRRFNRRTHPAHLVDTGRMDSEFRPLHGGHRSASTVRETHPR